MSRAVVLGAGRVGALIARDLARSGFAVRAVDARRDAVRPLADAGLESGVADLADPVAVRDAVRGADVAVGAVPGRMGLALLAALVEAGVPTVDISFSPEDPRALDEAARAKGIPMVVDCGVAPGLSNLLVGRAAAAMERVDAVRILVGGLPAAPEPPWGYRAVFSPSDVIEEYVRPCRMRVDGEDVVVPALSGIETVTFPEVGRLEAFCTDGLRSLLDTIDAPTLVEKTLRWPGHAERAAALRDSGFFGEEPVVIDGAKVVPRLVAERLLAEAWALPPGEEEFTLLSVEVEGEREGRSARKAWTLLDRTDPATGDTSMARTTAFPAAAVARLVVEGTWAEPGVVPPEILGADEAIARAVLDDLAARGVRVQRR